MGRFFRRREHPGVFWVDLVIFFVFAAAQDLVEKFVRKVPFTLFVGIRPDFQHGLFHAAHGFAFGNAGVRHAVHVAVEQRLFVLRRQRAIAGNAFVIVVGDEIENVFFEIRAGAGDQINFVAANHFGERKAEFRRAHRAAERDHHFAAVVEMRNVAFCGIHERRGVEVAIVVLDETGNRPAGNL